MKKIFPLITLSLMMFLGGCCSVVHWPWCPSPISPYYDIQKSIAKTLNENGLGGTNWQIAAVTGAFYPLGTVIYNGQPYKSCQFSSDVISNVPFAALPVVTNNNNSSFGVNLPAALAAKIGLTVGINVSSTNIFFMRFSNLNQVFIYAEDFHKEITNVVCQDIVDYDDQVKTILRGEITGTFEVSSSSSFGIGGNVTFTNVVGVTAQYNSNGGFDIQQTNPVPIFFIYSDISPIKNVTNVISNRIFLMASDRNRRHVAYKIDAPSPEKAAEFGSMTNVLLNFGN